jgi:hypothetical protein
MCTHKYTQNMLSYFILVLTPYSGGLPHRLLFLWALFSVLSDDCVPQGVLSIVPSIVYSAVIVWKNTLPPSSGQKSAQERVDLAFSKLN